MLGLSVFEHINVPSSHLITHVPHSLGVVLLPLLIAFVSCHIGFYILRNNQGAAAHSHQRIAWLCTAIVLGFGIWCMHFTGMLAMQLPTHVSYSVWKTAASILPSLAAAGIAIWTLQSQPMSTARMLLGGSLFGLGVMVMHYSGLGAAYIDGVVRLDLPQFLLASVAGVALSILSFASYRWVEQHARGTNLLYWRWLPPSLLAAAIANMHYLSMHAMRIALPGTSESLPSAMPDLHGSQMLSLFIASIAGSVFVILGLAHAAMRYRDHWHAAAARDARLFAMVEAADAGFISTDARGIILEYNSMAQQLFGYTKEEVLGRSVNMLMPSPLAEQHNAFLEGHLQHVGKPITNKHREVLGIHKDGKLIPLQLSLGKAITPSGLIFVAYLQDISERKRADAQLRIAASVFHHVHEGVAIMDAHYNITDVNPSFERLMEMHRQDCIGKSLPWLYETADIPPDMSGLWHTLATEQHWQAEVLLTRSNGQVWMQRISISPVFNEIKRPHHFIVVISDISERPSLEVMLPHAELHDSSTGLPTRKLFMDRLTSQLISSHRKSTHAGVVCVQFVLDDQATPHDLNNAQRLLAQLLEQQLRCTDTLSRYSKDLLAVLLPGIKDAASFAALVDRLTRSIQEVQHHYLRFHVQMLRISHASTLDERFSASDLMEAAIHSPHAREIPAVSDQRHVH